MHNGNIRRSQEMLHTTDQKARKLSWGAPRLKTPAQCMRGLLEQNLQRWSGHHAAAMFSFLFPLTLGVEKVRLPVSELLNVVSKH